MKKVTVMLIGLTFLLYQLAGCGAASGKGGADTLTMVKSFDQRQEWDGEILLAVSEYSGALLSDEAAAAYPALAEALAQTHAMASRSMEDEFDSLLATAKDELALLGADSFITKSSILDVQIRRADSVALSVLSDSSLVYGRINDRYLNGTTYDTATGEPLRITDVIRDMSKIPAIVKEELISHTWAGDFLSDTAVADYFRDTPEDGIRWTLDYNGVTFYFADGEIAEIGRRGHLAAMVSFAEHPELFNEKYSAVPGAYMVELPLAKPFYADLDGDGRSEELNVSPVSDADGLYWEAVEIFTDADAQYFRTELQANANCLTGGYHPYYIKTAEGKHYLYLFAESSELAAGDMLLRVIDITGGRFREVGDLAAAPGYIPVDCAWALTDPENMMLENFERMEEARPYRIGDDGLPRRK
ncbi:MAG: hypothetical protein E7632_12365 [Ruminococcaceae bacterium]|nr:hypothetical protein [Oscillospiraceae bacterium]